MLVLANSIGFGSDHQVESYFVSWFVVRILYDSHVLELERVNRIEAERAALPGMGSFKIEVLQHARPAVDVAAFCDSRTDHIL